jgi:hypothetical protein
VPHQATTCSGPTTAGSSIGTQGAAPQQAYSVYGSQGGLCTIPACPYGYLEPWELNPCMHGMQMRHWDFQKRELREGLMDESKTLLYLPLHIASPPPFPLSLSILRRNLPPPVLRLRGRS